MNDQIVQIISTVLLSPEGAQLMSIHGLSKSGVVYQLVSSDKNIPNWVKVIDSPIINN